MESTPLWVITVANGGRIISGERCKQFKWSVQGTTLEADLRIINLGGSDMILGHDWMWHYDPTTFMLKKNMLVVTKNGKKV